MPEEPYRFSHVLTCLYGGMSVHVWVESTYSAAEFKRHLRDVCDDASKEIVSSPKGMAAFLAERLPVGWERAEVLMNDGSGASVCRS